jgi:hypothetical protein
MNAFAGYQVNGSTFTDSTRNVFAASVIGIYAQLDKTAGSTYSSTLTTNQYNLALSNSSHVSATFAGLAYRYVASQWLYTRSLHYFREKLNDRI